MQELERLLDINFTNLGFTLSNFKCTSDSDFKDVVTFKVLCPCGGTEYVAFRVDAARSNASLATYVLSRVANREHLEEDVKKGLLPAFDIDKHLFTNLIK